MHISWMGYLPVAAPAVLAVVAAALYWRRTDTTVGSFYTANRHVDAFIGAIVTGAAWFWVFAFISGPEQAYLNGFTGLLSFSLPNALGLAVNGLIVWQIFKRMPQGGYVLPEGYGHTLPEFYGVTYDGRTRAVCVVGIVGIQGVYAVLAQLIGAQLLLNYATGIPLYVAAIIIALAMVGLAIPKGVLNSLFVDVLKFVAIAAIGTLAVVSLVMGDSAAMHRGLDGIRKVPLSLFDGGYFLSFTIPFTISIVAAASIDQQLYQRAYSLSRKGAGWALLFAPIVFFALSMSVGALGFLGAGSPEIAQALPKAAGRNVPEAQLIGFTVMQTIFSPEAGKLFIVAIALILIATGASALNAVGSVGAFDVIRAVRSDVSDETRLLVSRAVMLFFAVFGVAIALMYPNIRLIDMLLFVGAMRAALLAPTILGAFTTGRGVSTFFPWGIAGTMVLGFLLASGYVPVFDVPQPLRIAYASMTVLACSVVLCAIEWIRFRALR